MSIKLITPITAVIPVQLHGHYFTTVRTAYLGGFVDPSTNQPTLKVILWFFLVWPKTCLIMVCSPGKPAAKLLFHGQLTLCWIMNVKLPYRAVSRQVWVLFPSDTLVLLFQYIGQTRIIMYQFSCRIWVIERKKKRVSCTFKENSKGCSSLDNKNNDIIWVGLGLS